MVQRKKAKRLKIKLIKELRSNSSRSISNIARKIREPVTTVFEAERKLRQKGIITRYYSMLDFEKAGFLLRAFFMIKVDEDKLEETKRMLMADSNINNLQLLEGSCNLFAEAIFEKMERFLNFSEKLSGVTKKSVYYVLKEAKTEAAAIF